MAKRTMPISNKQARGMEISPEELRETNRNAAFPARLRTLRKQAGLSQQKMAQATKVTTSTIVKFEQGETVPDAHVLHRMAEFFDVSFDYLLCATDLKTTDMDVKHICLLTGLTEKSAEILIQIKAACHEHPAAHSLQKGAQPDYFVDKNSAGPLLKVLNNLIEELDDEETQEKILEHISEYILGEHALLQPDGTKMDSIVIELSDGKRKRISSKAIARDHLEAVMEGLNKMYHDEMTQATIPDEATVSNG